MNDNTRKIVYKRNFLSKILSTFNTEFQFKLLSFYKDKKIVDLIKSIKKEIDFAFYPIEAFHVFSIANSQSRIKGDMAEVGVYQGGSAKLICEAKKENKLHLFDTFEGLPEVSNQDTHFGKKYWETGEFNNTSLQGVKNYLSDYDNVKFYKGKFPETADSIEETQFSFVHLDVDLYQSTIDCLNFFFPRMVTGGIILTHDYHTSGVKRAFEEFFHDKKVPLLELSGSQCLVIKVTN